MRHSILILSALSSLLLCTFCGKQPEVPVEDEKPVEEKPDNTDQKQDADTVKVYNAFSFIQISDPQLGFISGQTLDFEADSLLLEEMVAEINRLKPAFLLVTGDMTNTSRQKDQIACYKSIIAKLDSSIPLYAVPGNHDIGGDSSTERVETYISNYGYDKFSFEYEGVSFIGINSPVIKDKNNEVEATQFSWMMDELISASDCRMRFIVSHYPFFLNSFTEEEDSKNLSIESRNKYWPVFKRRKVSCVISGHLHYSCFSSYNGIDMITMGAVGKPLGSGYSGAALWTIDSKNRYKYQYLSIDEFKALNTL